MSRSTRPACKIDTWPALQSDKVRPLGTLSAPPSLEGSTYRHRTLFDCQRSTPPGSKTLQSTTLPRPRAPSHCKTRLQCKLRAPRSPPGNSWPQCTALVSPTTSPQDNRSAPHTVPTQQTAQPRRSTTQQCTSSRPTRRPGNTRQSYKSPVDLMMGEKVVSESIDTRPNCNDERTKNDVRKKECQS